MFGRGVGALARHGRAHAPRGACEILRLMNSFSMLHASVIRPRRRSGKKGPFAPIFGAVCPHFPHRYRLIPTPCSYRVISANIDSYQLILLQARTHCGKKWGRTPLFSRAGAVTAMFSGIAPRRLAEKRVTATQSFAVKFLQLKQASKQAWTY